MLVFRFLPLLVIAFFAYSFQNCGQFKINHAKRVSLMQNTVLGVDNVYTSVNSLTAMTGTDEEVVTASPTPNLSPSPYPSGTPKPDTVVTPTPIIPAEKVDLPIKRHCDGADGKDYWWKYNQVGVVGGGAYARITDATGKVLCEIKNIDEQLKAGSLSIPLECLGGRTKQEFLDQLAYSDRTKPIKFQIFVLKNGVEWQINDPKKKKDNGKIMQQLDPSWIYMGNNPGANLCDQNLSPLFVDFRPPTQSTHHSPLTSPEKGVLFDLMGDFPIAPFAAFQKTQISWFTDSRLAFIVLPDAGGQVKGINELFGDRTKGPDGLSADNGFAALGKYDGYVPAGELSTQFSRYADGTITAKDWVFSRLRLWFDLNSNGVSDPGELRSLSEMGVKAIDLTYDENYREMDQYKNEIRYKSVLVRTDGSMLLVFDVWFALPKQ